MLIFKSACKALTLILLLLSLILYLTSTGVNAEEISYVPSGYVTPTAGYFFTEQAGRDVLEGWTSDKAAKEAYKAALDEVYSEWKAFKVSMEEQVLAIKDGIAAERAAFKAELRKAKRPGFGIFGGLGYTTDGDVQGVVGVGLVWKLY